MELGTLLYEQKNYEEAVACLLELIKRKKNYENQRP
jgi:hypothetical protein